MRTPSPAEKLLLSLGVKSPKEIDLEAIAATQGAFVKYKPLDQSEAMIVGNSKNAIITVNCRCRHQRQRFSIAHELGHWHYDRGRTLICSPLDVGNPNLRVFNPERHADEYASDLLLPSFLLRPILKEMRTLTLAGVRRIADEFDVSLTAALLKALREDMFPAIVVRHGRDAKSWIWSSKLVPEWWRVRQELDKETFAYAMLYEDASEERFPRSIPAKAWFDFKGVDTYEVKEQSFKPTPNEVVTILTVPEARY